MYRSKAQCYFVRCLRGQNLGWNRVLETHVLLGSLIQFYARESQCVMQFILWIFRGEKVFLKVQRILEGLCSFSSSFSFLLRFAPENLESKLNSPCLFNIHFYQKVVNSYVFNSTADNCVGISTDRNTRVISAVKTYTSPLLYSFTSKYLMVWHF